MKRYIQIEIDAKNGDIKTEAFGFRGKSCQVELNNIEKILGTNSLNRKPKPELKTTTHTERIKNK